MLMEEAKVHLLKDEPDRVVKDVNTSPHVFPPPLQHPVVVIAAPTTPPLSKVVSGPTGGSKPSPTGSRKHTSPKDSVESNGSQNSDELTMDAKGVQLRCGKCRAKKTQAGSHLLVCGRCRVAAYCSEEHQKQHWHIHRRRCRGSFTAEEKRNYRMKNLRQMSRGDRAALNNNLIGAYKYYKKSRRLLPKFCSQNELFVRESRVTDRIVCTLRQLGRFDEAMMECDLALKRYEKAPPLIKAFSCSWKSGILVEQGCDEASIASLLTAKTLCCEHDSKRSEAERYTKLAGSYNTTGDNERAKSYEIKARIINEQLPDIRHSTYMLVQIYVAFSRSQGFLKQESSESRQLIIERAQELAKEYLDIPPSKDGTW